MGIPQAGGDVRFQAPSVQEHCVVGLRVQKESCFWRALISLRFTLAWMFYFLRLVFKLLIADKVPRFLLRCCYIQTLPRVCNEEQIKNIIMLESLIRRFNSLHSYLPRRMETPHLQFPRFLLLRGLTLNPRCPEQRRCQRELCVWRAGKPREEFL